MGFTCEFCSLHIGPSIKPTKVVLETHATKQLGYNDEGNPVTYISHGPVAEFNQCPACAGIEVATLPKPDYSGYVAIMNAGIAHARACKKTIAECERCQKNMADLAKFPLATLSYCLREVQVRPAAPSMAEVLVGNLMTRTLHNTKRAKADFQVSYPVLKLYEQRGGGL